MQANAGSTVAIGNDAVASATAGNALAIGTNASAQHQGSVALGNGSVTTASNQVMLGATGTSVVVADIAASDATQSGTEQVVTIDSNGVLGVQNVASAASLNNVRVSMNYLAAVTEQQFSALESRVSGIEGSIDTLFDLTNTMDRDAQRAIASIAAQANPHFPSAPGRTSYASNVVYYRGEVGVSAGLMHRFDGDFAITAGVTYAGGNSTSVRAGIAGEF